MRAKMRPKSQRRAVAVVVLWLCTLGLFVSCGGVTAFGPEPENVCDLLAPREKSVPGHEPHHHDGFAVLRQGSACGPGSKKEPDVMTFPKPVESYARYDGQTQCSPSAKPGMKAFRDLILKTYPCTGDFGISRACSAGGKSEHKEGRAWDWKLNYPHPAADAVINWLLATRNGVPHAMARRVGLMYMVWNRRIWRAYRNPPAWGKYTGASPHTDHIHFSFSRAGGYGKTSFFSGKVGAAKRLDAKFVGQGTSAGAAAGGAQHSLCPGQGFTFWFKLQNTGNIIWTDVGKPEAGKAIRLGFQKGTTFGAPTRVSVNTTPNKNVGAGASTTFTLRGKAPTKGGVYKTEWKLVSELVQWFGPDMWLSFLVTSQPPGAGKSCQLPGGCGNGTMQCTSSGLACVGAKASPEVCDNKDNDCDGKTDEGLSRPCYGGPAQTQGVGRCRSGQQTCQAGKWGECRDAVLPTNEICGNTVDDDCDGQLDEGCGAQSGGCEDKDGDGYGVGKACQGEQDCRDDDKSVYPGAPEVCGNGKDDDCRGGDRPCQNTPSPGSSDAGIVNPDEEKQGLLCLNPPCKIGGSGQPDEGAPSRRRGCGCETSGTERSGGVWLWAGLLCLGLIRRRKRGSWED